MKLKIVCSVCIQIECNLQFNCRVDVCNSCATTNFRVQVMYALISSCFALDKSLAWCWLKMYAISSTSVFISEKYKHVSRTNLVKRAQTVLKFHIRMLKSKWLRKRKWKWKINKQHWIKCNDACRSVYQNQMCRLKWNVFLRLSLSLSFYLSVSVDSRLSTLVSRSLSNSVIQMGININGTRCRFSFCLPCASHRK